MVARTERLQHELDQALMTAEVNQAKGQMYDELAQHAKLLEQRNQSLVSAEAKSAAVEAELRSARALYKVRVSQRRSCVCPA